MFSAASQQYPHGLDDPAAPALSISSSSAPAGRGARPGYAAGDADHHRARAECVRALYHASFFEEQDFVNRRDAGEAAKKIIIKVKR
jgi:hypothetical protein